MKLFGKILVMIVVAILTSFYFFPVSFTFLPEAVNTKMILAVLGVVYFIVRSARTQNSDIPKSLLLSILWAGLFSMACLYATYHSATDDYAYATYIVSFFVWLFGALFVCTCIKEVHGKVNLRFITSYLAAVCVAQCVSALLIDNIPSFKIAVDSIFAIGQEFMEEVDRLYGIGAALDPAGVRFSITLILIAHLLASHKEIRQKNALIFWYVLAYVFIVVVGNMISRTTIVGAVLGIVYYFVYSFFVTRDENDGSGKILLITFLIVAIGTAICTTLYNTSPSFHKSMRFAFEGFFNLVEKGKWETSSTDKLNATMWIWPKTRDAWIWGTGLFDNFVYHTDIGYCRFILYCGIFGFSFFVLFFIHNALSLAKDHKGLTLLAFFLLALTFIIWIKVATDIFLIYALLYHMDPDEDEEEIEEEDEAEPEALEA